MGIRRERGGLRGDHIHAQLDKLGKPCKVVLTYKMNTGKMNVSKECLKWNVSKRKQAKRMSQKNVSKRIQAIECLKRIQKLKRANIKVRP